MIAQHSRSDAWMRRAWWHTACMSFFCISDATVFMSAARMCEHRSHWRQRVAFLINPANTLAFKSPLASRHADDSFGAVLCCCGRPPSKDCWQFTNIFFARHNCSFRLGTSLYIIATCRMSPTNSSSSFICGFTFRGLPTTGWHRHLHRVKSGQTATQFWNQLTVWN